MLMLLAVLLLATPFVTRAGDKKGDLELVQGTWMLVSAERPSTTLQGRVVCRIKG
jgi:hypothetical protein